MKKSLIVVSSLLVLISFFSANSYADTNCQSVYGGGQSCGQGNITVQKQVLKPGTNDIYVDSLGYNDDKYQPSSPIFFKITITNNTKSTLNNIIISDKIDAQHEFINFVSGAGTFNNANQTLSYKIPSLTPGQQNMLTLSGRVLDASHLPNQGIICAGNTVQVTVNNGAPTSAITSYCIQNTAIQPIQPTATQAPAQQTTKGGIPVGQVFAQPTMTPTHTPTAGGSTPRAIVTPTQTFPVFTGANNITRTPKSGPEALPLLAMIPAGGVGIWLRKKSDRRRS